MENNTKHTPGPWVAHTAHESLRVADSVNAECGLHVCDVASYGAAPSQRHANARLIAAAPDLLAALRAVMACPDLSRNDWDHDTMAVLRQSLAAIAKAEGRAE